MGPDVRPTKRLETTACVAGGGPAGLMLGLLLARAGVDVVVLEKHADFLRDFRGDTVHPSTLEVLRELGLLRRFLALPHQKIERVAVEAGGRRWVAADFTRLAPPCRFLALMPQADFLELLAGEASRHPTFRLVREAEVTGLVAEDGVVEGVRAATPSGPLEVRAALTVGADGRRSTVRAAAGLPRKVLGAPMDVAWLRLPREASDPVEPALCLGPGALLALLPREGYWQCGYVIPKGSFDELRGGGIETLRGQLRALAPFLGPRVEALRGFEEVRLLTVAVDRLRRWWRPGLLCLGDAAHAMSPIGGLGIHLAIQDAVAAANLLAAPLRRGAVSPRELRAVQRRRMLPTRLSQRAQLFLQRRLVAETLAARGEVRVPRALRLLDAHPRLRRLPARLVGAGVRPEHVRVAGT